MVKRMLVDACHPEELRVVIADDSRIEEFDFVTSTKKQNKGNIYLAKVTRVEPSLQAAFVEYGGNRQGFLPFAEIHPDYYQIPIADRQKLIEEEQALYDDDEDEAPRRRGGRRQQQETTSAAEADSYDEAAWPPLSDEAQEVDITALEQRGEGEDAPLLIHDETPPAHIPGAADTGEEALPGAFSDAGDDHPQPEGDEMAAITYQAESAGVPDASLQSREEKDEQVETLSEDDDLASQRRRNRFLRRYKIQEVIKRNQVILVQVIKEERGNKGAALTTYIALPGRYCVLMPNTSRKGGVSRKIANSDDRRQLRSLLSELELAKGMSVIIRTAGMGRNKTEIRRDFDYLMKLWNKIREETLSSIAPALIYEESNLIKRSIRDLYDSNITEVLVEGEEAHKEAKNFMKILMPSHAARVKLYKAETPIFHEFGVEEQLLTIYDPVVRLPSGATIVINSTEALVSIDVNSGRATRERNIEETALKTNLEAAREVARQIRLRDLAGLLVIDFIDMNEYRNRRTVERALKEALRQDRAKIQIGRISAFGLLEMSRQRLRPSITELNTHACPHCEGRGIVLSIESLALRIIRELEKEASENATFTYFKLLAPSRVALYLLNFKRSTIADIEENYKVRVVIEIDSRIQSASGFTIQRFKNPEDMLQADSEARGLQEGRRRDAEGRGRRRRRGGGGGYDRSMQRHQQQPRVSNEYSEQALEEAEIEAAQAEEAFIESAEGAQQPQEVGEGWGGGRDDNGGGGRRRRGGRRNRRRGGRRFQEDDNFRDGEAEFNGRRERESVEGEIPLPEDAAQAGDAASYMPEGGVEGDRQEGEREGRDGGGRRRRGRRNWRDRDRGDRRERRSDGFQQSAPNGEVLDAGQEDQGEAPQVWDDAPLPPREQREPREPREPRVSRAERESRRREEPVEEVSAPKAPVVIPVEQSSPPTDVEVVDMSPSRQLETVGERDQPAKSTNGRKGWWQRMIE